MGKKSSFSGSIVQGAGLAAGAIIVILGLSFVLGGVSLSMFGGDNITTTGGEPVYVSGVMIGKGSNTKVNDTIYVSDDLQNWEPVTPSNGAWTTTQQYSMGGPFYVFYPAGSYYASLQSFTVPQADTSKTTVSIGLVELYEISSSMTVVAQDTSGNTLSTSASAWLNTTSGTTSTIRSIVQNGDADSGFGDPRWQDTSTTVGTLKGYTNLPTDNYEYVGPFGLITVNTSSVVVSGALSSINIGSTYYYFVSLNPSSLWNDNDVSGDGIQVVGFDITPTADALITVGVYDYVRSDFLATVSVGSADASTSFKVNV